MGKKKFDPFKIKWIDEKKGPMCCIVKWHDHNSSSQTGWRDLNELKKPTPSVVHTAGWVVFRTDDMISVVPTMVYDGQCLSPMNILIRDIVSVQEIEDGVNWLEHLTTKTED